MISFKALNSYDLFNFEHIIYNEQDLMSRKRTAGIASLLIGNFTKRVGILRDCAQHRRSINYGKALTGGGKEVEFKAQVENVDASDMVLPIILFFPRLSMQT